MEQISVIPQLQKDQMRYWKMNKISEQLSSKSKTMLGCSAALDIYEHTPSDSQVQIQYMRSQHSSSSCYSTIHFLRRQWKICDTCGACSSTDGSSSTVVPALSSWAQFRRTVTTGHVKPLTEAIIDANLEYILGRTSYDIGILHLNITLSVEE